MIRQGILTNYFRLINSTSGNPRFKVDIDRLAYLTTDDMADAYRIGPEMLGRKVVFTLDHGNRIDSIKIRTPAARLMEANAGTEELPLSQEDTPPEVAQWLQANHMHYDTETGWFIGTNHSKSGAYPMLRPNTTRLSWVLKEDADPESIHSHHQALARYLGRRKQS